MSLITPPPDYPRIKLVHSFDELIGTRFGGEVNALCWPRTLDGDFGEVVRLLAVERGITSIDEDQLEHLPASAAGRTAIDVLRRDLHILRELDLQPSLDCVNGYVNDEDPGLLPTDVCSFHADSATVEADTYLCTYFGPSSEGLRNDQAQRHVDVPAIRATLLKGYGGEDDAGFAEYLRDNCYDLHYAAAPQAEPFTFGVGNLWRIAIEYDGCPVPPCIHRAPKTIPGLPPRLMLIS